jgi:large subunit ribosomal protein L29
MKAAKWREMSDDEVQQKARELGEELFNLRLRNATGELENTARIGLSRRDVARLLTIARQRGIDLEKELK